MFQGAWKCVYFCLDWLPWMDKTVGRYRIWDSQVKALWIQLARRITLSGGQFLCMKNGYSIPNWTEDSWANWSILWRSFDFPLGECDATHGSIQLGRFQCYRTGTFRGEPLVQCLSELSKLSHQSEYPYLPSSKLVKPMTLVATPHFHWHKTNTETCLKGSQNPSKSHPTGCAELKDLCSDPDARLLRMICGATCGCSNPYASAWHKVTTQGCLGTCFFGLIFGSVLVVLVTFFWFLLVPSNLFVLLIFFCLFGWLRNCLVGSLIGSFITWLVLWFVPLF